MRRLLTFSIALLLAAHTAPADDLARAREILRQVPIIDGHNDTPYQFNARKKRLDEIDLRDTSALEPKMHTDIPRLRAGGVGGQFWSIYVDQKDHAGSAAAVAALGQVDLARRIVAAYPDAFELASSSDDVVRIQKKGKIASMFGVEGGHSIGNSLGVLRLMYDLGARYMTLTHSQTNDFADSATDAPRHGGLSPFGVEVVREMNRLGMLVDLSHVSRKTMLDALAVTEAPVIFSHSTALALTDHPRNVPDDILRMLPKNGGVVMVDFVPSFVNQRAREYSIHRKGVEESLKERYRGEPERAKSEFEAWKVANPPPPVQISDVADHIDHIRKTAGIDHIGIGSDFDGISQTVIGLSSVADYPNLFAELLRRGYSESDLKKISGQNILRVMRGAEEVARRLQKERLPSEAAIAAEERRQAPEGES
jgi:membrane dipeptidase